ncbi:hypothetical protein EBT25_01365, partial [bacterium]|nr:hypothetical protein [bacterium]
SSGIELNVGEVVAPDLAESIKVITNGGGTSQSVLDTLASLQTQINNLIPSQTGNSGKFLTTNGSALSWASVAGGLSYQGTWNASTNSPTLTSSVGTNGYYYVVGTSGSTNLNGITDWQVGDWLLFNGSAWQKIDQSDTLQTITSADASLTVSTVGSNVDISVTNAPNVVVQVRNSTGATLTKGTAVYISGATGQIPTVSKALATSDATSAQTLGLMSADLANNTNGYVTVIGLITEIDTSAYTDGDQLYLSGTTAGTLTATKTYAPTHLVYVAVVEYAHAVHGKLFVKVQNGYELDEIHNVSAQSPSNGQTIIYNASTSLWEKAYITAGTGISVTNGAGSITVANTGVTSVTATAPVSSSGGATPAISLATGYGDTQNPYASKTANYVLAAPNGSAGVPTFRAIVAADIPTLNQNTTGSAASLSSTLAIASGGTGQTTANAAFNALAPSQSTNSGKYLTTDGTNTSWATVSGGSGTVTSVAQSFTGGLISVSGSPVTTSGTLALSVAGTSGGIPYFSGASTWASSAALAANALVVGGGAGSAPSTVTTGTGVVTALGVNTGSSGAFVVNGGALGTPSSGTVTNLTGTASININGTVGATTANTGAFTTLSASSTVSGTGFSTYLASPPAIGGTTAANGSFATLSFNSGYGSVATAYGCRAWVNFVGSTASISGNGNVSSITRNAAGDYTVNFTNAMPDANYAVTAWARSSTAGNYCVVTANSGTGANSTASAKITVRDSGPNLTDPSVACVAIFR